MPLRVLGWGDKSYGSAFDCWQATFAIRIIVGLRVVLFLDLRQGT